MKPRRIVVDALADMHKHLRDPYMHSWLIELAMEGGADLLGLQPNVGNGLQTANEVETYLKHAQTATLWDKKRTRMLSHDAPRPFMLPFLMITEETSHREIDKCVERGIEHAKIYPRYRTTKSEAGVVRYGRIIPKIQHCGSVGMNVHMHPEHPNMKVSNRDAEYSFIAIVQMFLEETNASIIWEHGTDGRCIPFWEEWAKTGRFAVTLTAHHLATNEDLSFGDVRATCKPPIKTELDRMALLNLVAKNYPWVMAGGDDAFHPKDAKHVAEGRCACGACTGPFLMPLYAHACNELLTTKKGVETFINFTSRNARGRFGLPAASRQLVLENIPFHIPLEYETGRDIVMPFWAGQTLDWRIKNEI